MKIVAFDVGIANCGVCSITCANQEPKIDLLMCLDLRPRCSENECDGVAAVENVCQMHGYRRGIAKGLPKPSTKDLEQLPMDAIESLYRTLTKSAFPTDAPLRKIWSAIRKAWPSKCKRSSGQIPLQDIARGIRRECDKLAILSDTDVVVIENQYSPKANRMLCIQGMITQYAIMQGVENVVYAAGTAKLSLVPKNHSCYSERKTASVKVAQTICRFMGFEMPSIEKDDDMADSLLHALVFAIKSGLCRNVVAECLELFHVNG